MITPRHTHRRTLTITAAAMALSLTLGSAASRSASASSASAKVGGTLTVVGGGPTSLNPIMALPFTDYVHLNLTYAALTRFVKASKFAPDLATRWGYVGSKNETFQLTIRQGVKFADGEALTAKAVANSITAFSKGPNGASYLPNFKGVTAKGSTVTLTFKAPTPDAPLLLSDKFPAGWIISPKGLANPSSLGSSTAGAGEYVLDTKSTVANSTYVYTANPKYWDKSAVHFKKVVINNIPNTQSAIQAVKTGQANYTILQSPADLVAARAGGLKISVGKPNGVQGMSLLDRDGVVTKALKDVRVRQALNYAIDRQAIVKGLFPGIGKVTDQISFPVYPDTVDPATKTMYPYNPAKAKKLLAAAGYAKGFTLPVNIGFDPLTPIAQAVVNDWQKIGVKVEETKAPTFPAWFGQLMSRKFSASFYIQSGEPMYLLWTGVSTPVPTPSNPFATQDPALTKLFKQASVQTNATAERKAFQKLQGAITKAAWFAPVVELDFPYVTNGVKVTALGSGSNLTTWMPS